MKSHHAANNPTHWFPVSSGLRRATFLAAAGLCLTGSLSAQTQEELQARINQLEQELAEARAALSSQESATAPEGYVDPATVADAGPKKVTPGDVVSFLDGWTIGGAIRANYVLGDYPNGGSPTRGGDGGNFELDVFRFNVDYANGPYSAKFEYRFYNGYNFLHTGWLGYTFSSGDTLQLGLNRVPFGPGAYGVSQSWFFDQHYYVGLSDDMDIGAKYTMSRNNMTVDFGLYALGDIQWKGSSQDSARYSYDVVDESGDGYSEMGQANVRAIWSTQMGAADVDLGGSLQYGLLESDGPQDDGTHFAASLHAVAKINNWTIAPQITYYKYDVDPHTVQSGAFTDQLIDMGAYDFAWPVAAEAFIPALSISYYHEFSELAWLDYVIPYVEYSAILKEEAAFNDSSMFIVGAAWARGGWFIYTDLAFSDGNYFVGGDSFTTFGANPTDEWQYRLNVNFGYYF